MGSRWFDRERWAVGILGVVICCCLSVFLNTGIIRLMYLMRFRFDTVDVLLKEFFVMKYCLAVLRRVIRSIANYVCDATIKKKTSEEQRYMSDRH